ncbi:MAG: BA2930 family N-acetyltransferase [Anaerolineae bacterium]
MSSPVTTVSKLAEDLRSLGLGSGMVVMVHTSYRAVGAVEGGPIGVVRALRAVVGSEGTLVMPAHTMHLTDPANWRDPAVPEYAWRGIRLGMRPFEPASTPTSGMGVVAELFRRMPGTLRSRHPIESVCAQGPLAERITARQPWNAPAGPLGPLGQLYELDAYVLLLGVNHNRNTSIHLAEELLPVPYQRVDRVPVYLHGRIVWEEVRSRAVCSEGFVRLDPLLDEAGLQVHGRVGQAHARFVRQRAVVDLALAMLRDDPFALLCPPGECAHCDHARATVSAQWVHGR